MKKYLSLLVFILVSLSHYPQVYAQANIAPLIENAKKLADRGSNDSALDIVDSALNLAKKQSDNKSVIRAMNLKGTQAMANELSATTKEVMAAERPTGRERFTADAVAS